MHRGDVGRLVGSLGPILGGEGQRLAVGIQSLDAVFESVMGLRGSLSSLGQGRREQSCFVHGIFLILAFAKSTWEPLKPKGGIPEASLIHPQ